MWHASGLLHKRKSARPPNTSNRSPDRLAFWRKLGLQAYEARLDLRFQDQAMLAGVLNQLMALGQVELVHQVGAVSVDGAGADD